MRPVPASYASLHYIYLSDEPEDSDSLTPLAFESYDACYPECAEFITSLEASGTYVAVGSQLGDDLGENAAALISTFAAVGALAPMLHSILVEIYIYLTPAETARLRRISYQRQMERGYKNPGSAGIVAQLFGDAENAFLRLGGSFCVRAQNACVSKKQA